MEKLIDLRSDTITKPNASMRQAMANAPVGDDVSREDPTVNELEEKAARLLGKEAALFCPSGTFANQLAVMTHINRGEEVYLSDESHIVQHECGAASILSGAFLRCIEPKGDFITWDEIEPKIRKVDDIHFPKPGLIELENPLSNGCVMNLEEMEKVRRGAERYNIPVHMDGARLFNAALYLNVSPEEIAEKTDSLMFCLSKGLGAPVGSLLCGTTEFIERARFNRKIMGGGMRQVGILAAGGLYALDHMLGRLADDHQNCRDLAEAFGNYNSFTVLKDRIHINMFYTALEGCETLERQGVFLDLLREKGILTYPPEGGFFRFVTSCEVTREDVKYVIDALPHIMKKWDDIVKKEID